MIYKITFAQGHGSVRHNNRDFVASNVDRDRVQDNVVLCQESLENAYRNVFEESIEDYNLHQKQRCRRLTVDKYMDKIKQGQDGETNPKLSYETIVQIGNKDNAGFQSAPETAQKMSEILACYYEDFVKRNSGHIYVYNAVIHMDEATPHMHIDWIPYADGYKRGLQRRNSLEKAMGQLGYAMDIAAKTRKRNNRSNWQDAERDRIKVLCRSMGMDADYERHDQPEIHLSPDEFRKLGRMVDRRLQDEVQKAMDRASAIKDEYLHTYSSQGGLKAILGRFRDNGPILNKIVTSVAQSQALAEAHMREQQANQAAALQDGRAGLQMERSYFEEQKAQAQEVIDSAAVINSDFEDREKALKLQEQEIREQRQQLENLRRQVEREQEKADKDKADAKQVQQDKADWEAFKKAYPTEMQQRIRINFLETWQKTWQKKLNEEIDDLRGKLDKKDKSLESVLSVLDAHELSLINDTGLSPSKVLQMHINAETIKARKEGVEDGKAAAAEAAKDTLDTVQKDLDDTKKTLADVRKSKQAYEKAWQDLTRDLRDNHNLKAIKGRDGTFKAQKMGIHRQQSKSKGMER